jgi:hypothetical protein
VREDSEGNHSCLLHGHSSHCLSVDHRFQSRSYLFCRARAPSRHRGQTTPRTLARKFRQVTACDRALLARGYHLPWHGAFLPSYLPRSFVECPPGNSVLQLVSSKGGHEHGGRVSEKTSEVGLHFFGIGIREGQQQEWWIFRSDTRLREDPCVLYDEFIVQTVEFFF